MPSFENNTSAFFWGSVSFSCNSSLPDDAGCKSAFFMESASSPGRAACRNSISYSFRFCFLFQERGKAAAKALSALLFPMFRKGLFREVGIGRVLILISKGNPQCLVCSGYGVVATAAPRVATDYTFQGKQTSFEGSVFFDCFQGILGTARRKTACGRCMWRDGCLIEAY